MLPRPPEHEIEIDFVVEAGIRPAWDRSRTRELVHAILARHFSAGGHFAISLHLVGDETIRALNAEHRGKDVRTDVLSFPLESDAIFVLPPDWPVHLGDVVVSQPRAVAQAREFGHSTEREIAYLVAHGVLHILGYDHEVAAERAQMRQREEEALQPLGFTR
jgi:probable rRNA maturation factor